MAGEVGAGAPPGRLSAAAGLLRRKGHEAKADALLHRSGQGSQYTSEQFQRLLADNGITCSRSRAGNVWNNSAMERFLSSLKIERTNRKLYRTRDEARVDLFDCTERFYNPRRRHSKLGYISPCRSRPVLCQLDQMPTKQAEGQPRARWRSV